LGAVVDHVEAFSRGGAHDETNFVTACNKCNARKNNVAIEDFKRAAPSHPVKGKYGEPVVWDGFSTIFVLLARGRADLSPSEKKWLAAFGLDRSTVAERTAQQGRRDAGRRSAPPAARSPHD
jgi:hypothetical protein